MISEREAKEKWCPQARFAIGNRKDNRKENTLTVADHGPSWNMVYDTTRNSDYVAKCMGSECMAWRWAEKSAVEVPMIGDIKERKGYCGAYGKPDFPDTDE